MTKSQSPRISLLDKCQLIVSVFLSFTQVINCEKEKKTLKKALRHCFANFLITRLDSARVAVFSMLKSSSSDNAAAPLGGMAVAEYSAAFLHTVNQYLVPIGTPNRFFYR